MQLTQLTNTFHTDREMSATSRERLGEKITEVEKIIIDIKAEARSLNEKVENMEPHIELWRDTSNKAKGFYLALVIGGSIVTAIGSAAFGYFMRKVFG